MTSDMVASEMVASPLDALTGALVASNDRLLGLIGLTERVAMSLDEDDLVNDVVLRAIDILGLDGVALRRDGDSHATHQTWGVIPRLGETTATSWSADHDLDGYGSLGITAWREDPPLDTGDSKVLAAVANLLASNIRVARMHIEALNQALVASEHDTAARITTAALQDPQSPPSIEGFTVHAHLAPARTTGGDLWAWHRTGSDLWFALGDVSGKGLPAAVMMATVVTATRDAFARHADEGPVAVVDAVARQTYRALSTAGMFTTFLVGRLTTAGLVHIANAGHSPAVAVRQGMSQRVEATAPPIGVIEGLSPTEWSVDLAPGDALVLATDGFTEQRDANGEAFGEEAFDRAIAAAVSETPDAASIGTSLVTQLIEHTRGTEPDDDRTLLVLHADPL